MPSRRHDGLSLDTTIPTSPLPGSQPASGSGGMFSPKHQNSVLRKMSTELMSKMSLLGPKHAPHAKDARSRLERMGDNDILFEGNLEKRGAAAGAGFRSRWFKVCKLHISYCVSADSGSLDNIEFNDIVGVVAKTSAATADETTIDGSTSPVQGATPGSPLPRGLGLGSPQSPCLDFFMSQRPAQYAKRPQSFPWSHTGSIPASKGGSGHSNRGSRRFGGRPAIMGASLLENRWRPGEWAEKDEADKVPLGPLDWMIVTAQGGYHDGRHFVLRSESIDAKERWVETVSRVLELYHDTEIVQASAFTKVRRKVRWFYVGDRCQIFVACLIMGNFLTNIFEAQFAAEPGSSTASIFDNIDIAFTIIFTIELCINMFATLVREFIIDGWNWFDVVVVLVSLLSLGMSNLPGADILRLMRCFRVFRLFKRIPSLRQIIVALSASVPPMINAFALVCLVTAIYAIMSVTFYRKIDPEYFGDFFTAMFTMFQVMTGDNWSEIARDLFIASGNGPATAVFFVSFQLIVALVLVNVVIAVLLDEFSKAAENKSHQSAGLDEGNCSCPFVRLSETFANYRDLEDLEFRIHDVFAQIANVGMHMLEMDLDGDEDAERIRLDYESFRAGVKKLDFIPPILISSDDWNEQVVNRQLISVDERLGVAGFRELMKHSVRRYQTWLLHNALEEEADAWEKEQYRAMYIGVKGMLAEDQEQSRRHKLAPSAGASPLHQQEQELATDELLKRLLVDMGRLNKRFENVERDLRAAGPSINANNANANGNKRVLQPVSSIEEQKGKRSIGDVVWESKGRMRDKDKGEGSGDRGKGEGERQRKGEANGNEGKEKKNERDYLGRVAYSKRSAVTEAAGGKRRGEEGKGKEEGGTEEDGKAQEKERRGRREGQGKEDEGGGKEGRAKRRDERDGKAREGRGKGGKEKGGRMERSSRYTEKREREREDGGEAGAQSAREGQLTQRGAPATPKMVAQQGWGFFTQQFMDQHPAGVLKEPANVLEQSGQAVNNLVGGFLGGLTAIGKGLPFGQSNDAGPAANGARQ